MKITNKEVVEMLNSISEMVNENKAFPVRFSYALMRNHAKLLEVYKPFEQLRDKIFLDCGVVKNENTIQAKKGCEEKFIKDMESLLSIENDIDFVGVKVADLPETIAPRDLFALDKFIED